MNFLKCNPNTCVARREIARKALNRRVFEEDPHWVDAPLASLTYQHLVEQDADGHYRIRKFEG